MTYRYTPGRHANGHSRPVGFLYWSRERSPLVFEDCDLVLNPWDHITAVPEEDRASSFGLANTFSQGSYFRFHRDGQEYQIAWCDIQTG